MCKGLEEGGKVGMSGKMRIMGECTLYLNLSCRPRARETHREMTPCDE